jgi:hypothetical protein
MFALQKNQISKPVLSPDGYHIIWLRDVRSGESKPFEEVRDQLVKEASAGGRIASTTRWLASCPTTPIKTPRRSSQRQRR